MNGEEVRDQVPHVLHFARKWDYCLVMTLPFSLNLPQKPFSFYGYLCACIHGASVWL